MNGALSASKVAAMHARRALELLRDDPDTYLDAIEHARSGSTQDLVSFLQLAEASGKLALAAGDCERACALLGIVVELGDADDPLHRRTLLFELARAHEGCGKVAASNRMFGEVIRLAAAAGDDGLAVDAAVHLAWPADWRAGDRRVASLLDLAEELHGDGPRRAALIAARAVIQMRVPASPAGVPQVAWVTRASVAQPLAERALEMTDGLRNRDRLLALAAWRSTNRRPDALERRLEISRDSVDLAQSLLDHQFIVDTAAALAIDHLEACDRGGYDEAIAMVNWAAATGGDPRLRWWAATMRAGVALLDGDLDGARRHRLVAYELGERHDLPGWVAAEILLAAELAFAENDRDEMRGFLVPSDEPILTSPIARSSVALMAALLGERSLATDHATTALRSLDPESSMLLCATLLARAAVELEDRSLAEQCREVLSPWSGRFAVDGNGWWCIGPVDLALAELGASLGQVDEAARHLAAADAAIDAMQDGRSAGRADQLRRRLDTTAPDTAKAGARRSVALLSEREREVLALLARGHTNAEIGAMLAFSASTIRADTVSIYRKLGVKGRPEAAVLAVTAGLA